MTHLDLFAGIGGFSLAAQWMGWTTVAQVEWDEWCQKVLAKNFPDALRFGDIVEFNKMLENGEITTDTNGRGRGRQTGIRENDLRGSTEEEQNNNADKGDKRHGQPTNIGHIDIITGGFPCQPFSHAGKRKGTDDSRYLWPAMLETIRRVKPTYVVGENVAGLVSMENGKTLDRILSDLEDEGYTTEQVIIPACAVGAWHRRDRIWIIAHLHGAGFKQGYQKNEGRPSEQFNGNSIQHLTTYVNYQGLQGGLPGREFNPEGRQEPKNGRTTQCSIGGQWNGQIQWATEPSVGRRFNGLPLWLYRHTIKGHGQTESYRRIEILRELWATIPTQVLWQVIGGFNQIQKSEVLFAIVCEYEARPNETRILLESQETLKEFVRGLWMRGEITGSSHRPDKGEQSAGEHTDSLQTLSRLLAHDLQENWQVSSWEDGIPRVSTGIKNRVDRLKGLGNAIVPQVIYEIFKAIEQYDNL